MKLQFKNNKHPKLFSAQCGVTWSFRERFIATNGIRHREIPSLALRVLWNQNERPFPLLLDLFPKTTIQTSDDTIAEEATTLSNRDRSKTLAFWHELVERVSSVENHVSFSSNVRASSPLRTKLPRRWDLKTNKTGRGEFSTIHLLYTPLEKNMRFSNSACVQDFDSNTRFLSTELMGSS